MNYDKYGRVLFDKDADFDRVYAETKSRHTPGQDDRMLFAVHVEDMCVHSEDVPIEDVEACRQAFRRTQMIQEQIRPWLPILDELKVLREKVFTLVVKAAYVSVGNKS